MASISLYRKYRPQTFAEVVGQDHVTTTLSQAVTEDRLHHAYLFTGPRGTGKTSTARILAKSLNCEHGQTANPCNACAQCEQITAGSHVDVIEIDAASHGGVDDVRDLRDRVAFAPAQARLKVYIVDECHMLSTAGWNAFLKTVEEPPGHVVFVFATTEPHKVLDTILSRTQRFDFRRVAAPVLTELATDLAAREGLALEEGALELVVRAGEGSVRDTLSILDQVIAFTGTEVTVAGVAEVLGKIPDELLAEIVHAIATGDVAAVCTLVGRAAEAGHDLRQLARDTVEHLRALFLLQVAPEEGLVVTTPERLARLQAQAGLLGRVELLRAVELLVEAQGQMRRGQIRLPLEIALAKAAMPEASGDAGALAARLDRLERRSGIEHTPDDSAAEPSARPETDPSALEAPAPAPETVLEPTTGETRPPATPDASASESDGGASEVDLELLRRSWPAVLDALKQRKKRWHAYVSMSRPAAFDGAELTLEFKAGYGLHAEQCGSDKGQEVVAAALERVLGISPRLRCTVAAADGEPELEVGPDGLEPVTAEAAAVAESEEAEASGQRRDVGTTHDEAIARLQTELGARVLEDERE